MPDFQCERGHTKPTFGCVACRIACYEWRCRCGVVWYPDAWHCPECRMRRPRCIRPGVIFRLREELLWQKAMQGEM